MKDWYEVTIKYSSALGILFATSSLAIAEPQISNKLKDNLLKGYMQTCVSAIKQQLPSISNNGISAYCACLGGKTFESISVSEYNFIIANGRLPPNIEQKRVAWRSQCNSLLD